MSEVIKEIVTSYFASKMETLLERGGIFDKLVNQDAFLEDFEFIKRDMRDEYSSDGTYIFRWKGVVYGIDFYDTSHGGTNFDKYSLREMTVSHKTIEVYE